MSLGSTRRLARRALEAIAPRAYLASLVLGVIIGILLIAWSFTPQCRFSGIVSGVVAPLWYKLEYYHEPVSIDALDAVRLIAISPTALGFYLVLHPLVALQVGRLAGSELALGGAMAYLSLGITPPLLSRLIAITCRGLDVDAVYRSSAGLVDLGTTSLYKYHGALTIGASIRVYVALALVYVALAVIGYFHEHGYLRRKED